MLLLRHSADLRLCQWNVRCIIYSVQWNLMWQLDDNMLPWRCKRKTMFSNYLSDSAYRPQVFPEVWSTDDGSNDLRSIDIPIDNFIYITVGSVLRELRWCTPKYEFWLVTVSYDILRTWSHVNGLCVVFPDRIDNGARNCRHLHIRRALQAEELFFLLISAFHRPITHS